MGRIQTVLGKRPRSGPTSKLITWRSHLARFPPGAAVARSPRQVSGGGEGGAHSPWWARVSGDIEHTLERQVILLSN